MTRKHYKCNIIYAINSHQIIKATIIVILFYYYEFILLKQHLRCCFSPRLNIQGLFFVSIFFRVNLSYDGYFYRLQNENLLKMEKKIILGMI
jgi:hypothetical protein